MPEKSRCPLNRPLPAWWTLCDTLALAIALPLLLFGSLAALGWLFLK